MPHTAFGGDLPPTDTTTQRLATLDASFAAQQDEAKLWQYGWMSFNGTSTAWNIFEATQDKKHKDRSADIVEATEGAIGIADLIFRPLPVLGADDACPKVLDTIEDRQECLIKKEAIAEAQSERWNERYEFLPHAEILAANALAGGIVWKLSTFARALATAAPGEVIGEIQLWTVPGNTQSKTNMHKIRFEPLVQETSRANETTFGVNATMAF